MTQQNPFDSITNYDKIRMLAETFAKGLVQANSELDVVVISFGWADGNDDENTKRIRPNGVVVPRDNQLEIKHVLQIVDSGHIAAKYAVLQLAQTTEAVMAELDVLKVKDPNVPLEFGGQARP